MTILGSGSVQITISPRTAPVIVGITQTRHLRFIASIQKKIKKVWRNLAGM